MFQQKPTIYYTLPIIIISTLVAIAIVLAWTEPTQAPPGGNVSSPINVGDTTQYKSGSLGVGGIFHTYNIALFDGSVGIGPASPQAKLDIAGQIKITDGSEGAGKVLTSDSNGVGTWQTRSGLTYLGSCSTITYPFCYDFCCIFGNCPANIETCKCNNGETIMVLEGGSQTDYSENFGCWVYNQNQTTVYGRANPNGTHCYFACLK